MGPSKPSKLIMSESGAGVGTDSSTSKVKSYVLHTTISSLAAFQAAPLPSATTSCSGVSHVTAQASIPFPSTTLLPAGASTTTTTTSSAGAPLLPLHTTREAFFHFLRHHVQRYRLHLLEHLRRTVGSVHSSGAATVTFPDVEQAILGFRTSVCSSTSSQGGMGATALTMAASFAAVAGLTDDDVWKPSLTPPPPPPPLQLSKRFQLDNDPSPSSGAASDKAGTPNGSRTSHISKVSIGVQVNSTTIASGGAESPFMSSSDPPNAAAKSSAASVALSNDVAVLQAQVQSLLRDRAELELRLSNCKKELHALHTHNGVHPAAGGAGLTSSSLLLLGGKGGGAANGGLQRPLPPRSVAAGKLKARLAQNIRDLRSRIAVIRTGVKAWPAGDVVLHFSNTLAAAAATHASTLQRTCDRTDYFERTLLNLQSRLLALPDDDCYDGYEVRRNHTGINGGNGGSNGGGRIAAHQSDTRSFNEFCTALTHSLELKLGKIELFAQRGARALTSVSSLQHDRHAITQANEARSGKLDVLCADWECLSVSIAAESVFENVSVQASRKLEFTSLQRSITEANDEIRVACAVGEWYAKPHARLKVAGWRERRLDATNRLEHLLSQELQHFVMNGPQRNFLRRKVLLLRELCALLRRADTSVASPSAAMASFNALAKGSTGGGDPPGTAAAVSASSSSTSSGFTANGSTPPSKEASGSGTTGSSSPSTLPIVPQATPVDHSVAAPTALQRGSSVLLGNASRSGPLATAAVTPTKPPSHHPVALDASSPTGALPGTSQFHGRTVPVPLRERSNTVGASQAPTAMPGGVRPVHAVAGTPTPGGRSSSPTGIAPAAVTSGSAEQDALTFNEKAATHRPQFGGGPGGTSRVSSTPPGSTTKGPPVAATSSSLARGLGLAATPIPPLALGADATQPPQRSTPSSLLPRVSTHPSRQ